MTNPLQIVILAALTFLVMALFPTASAAAAKAAIICETSKDCPSGSRCKLNHKHPKRPGVCVGASSKKK